MQKSWTSAVGVVVMMGACGLFSSCGTGKKPAVILVTNPIDVQRINEGVVISREQLPARWQKRSFILKSESGQEIPSQQDDLDGDGVFDELYFQMSLAPRETSAGQVHGGVSKTSAKVPFKTLNQGGVLSVETERGTLVTQGPEDLRFFLPGAKYPVWTAGYSVPEPVLRDVQARVLCQGPLRVVLEQKALWRQGSDVYIFNHRIQLAANDPLIHSTIVKTKWPEGGAADVLGFEVKPSNHRIRTLSTRWLFFGEGSQVIPWVGAVVFKAAQLQNVSSTVLQKGACRHFFAGTASGVNVGWLIGAQQSGNFQEIDRQAERAQQRWLNPMDVIISE
jgi:hypothetical protein